MSQTHDPVTGISDTFRPKYRTLLPEEQKAKEDILVAATVLETKILAAVHNRWRSLALTALEQSVMWAVKAITG